MRLATRIGWGFAVLVVLLAGLAAYQLALVEGLRTEVERLTAIRFAALDLGQAVEVRLDRVREFSEKLVVLKDIAYATALDRLRHDVEVDLVGLADLDLAPREGAALAGLLAVWLQYADDGPALEGSLLADKLEPSVLRQRVADHLEAIEGELAKLMTASRAAMAEQVAASRRRAQRAVIVAWGSSGLALALSLTLSAAIMAPVARSLRRLAAGTDELARGHFEHRVEADGGAELASLAASFNKMAERLSELDGLKREFVAAVSHDLKAPLASMQESTRVLLDGLAGPLDPRQERLLRLNLQSSERLSLMIRDLLDLARLDAGVREYTFERCHLAGLAAAAADEIEPLAWERKVSLQRELSDPELAVECDEGAVRQALGNLLSNAVKFTPPGGRVTLRLRELQELGATGRGAVIEVDDTGPGIRDELKERVFERFFRLDSGAPGTGLGLAIARGIAEGHGGGLTVEDAPGGGCRFRLRLPMAPPPWAARRPATTPEPIVEASSRAV